MSNPIFICQFPTAQEARLFREGTGSTNEILPISLPAKIFWCLSGIDALYLPPTRAEKWGSKPGQIHRAQTLETTPEERESGMPKYILSGIFMNPGEPNTAEHALPIIIGALLRACRESEKSSGGTEVIRSVAIFGDDLNWFREPLDSIGRIFARTLAIRIESDSGR